MIDQATRTTLRQKIKTGDYERAAEIYKQKTKYQITPSQLHKFLTGKLKYEQGNLRKHHPEHIFAAIADTVAERQQIEQKANHEAQEILLEILRDTAPTQPIHL